MPHARTVYDVILYARIIIYAYIGILMSKAFFFLSYWSQTQLPGVALSPCANRIRGARNIMQYPRLFIARSTNDKNPLDSTRTSPMSTSKNKYPKNALAWQRLEGENHTLFIVVFLLILLYDRRFINMTTCHCCSIYIILYSREAYV